jgi:hypothetical protein
MSRELANGGETREIRYPENPESDSDYLPGSAVITGTGKMIYMVRIWKVFGAVISFGP